MNVMCTTEERKDGTSMDGLGFTVQVHTTQRAPLSGGAGRMTDETFRIHNINYIVSRPDEQLRPIDCSNGIIGLIVFSLSQTSKE
jgi:hypothetical protein